MLAVAMFVLLLAGHAIGDSILQPGWLSQRKRDKDVPTQLTALALHGSVHALPVALVTGSAVLGLLELILHPLIDWLKSRGYFGLKTDQVLHVACKVAWLVVLPGLHDRSWMG